MTGRNQLPPAGESLPVPGGNSPRPSAGGPFEEILSQEEIDAQQMPCGATVAAQMIGWGLMLFSTVFGLHIAYTALLGF